MTATETPSAASADSRNREVLMRFWELAEQHEWDAASLLVHPDVVMQWPQSGEHFTGRANALAALKATEEKPEMAGEPRIVGAGGVWVTSLPLRYGEEVYHYVGVFELEDGLITRSTEYFGAPFPPQAARAPFADPA